MGRLYRAIARLAGGGDYAAFGTCERYLGGGRYRVMIAGTAYDVAAAGDATAQDGQVVAVLMSGETGQALVMLGRVSPQREV